MNPAMCVGKDAMQAGNPRNAQGRTAVYKAQRTQDGGAQWVLKGQVPVPGVSQHVQQPAYGSDPWAGYQGHAQGPAPRVRKSKAKKSKKSKRSTK